jgi:hypothetical protein
MVHYFPCNYNKQKISPRISFMFCPVRVLRMSTGCCQGERPHRISCKQCCVFGTIYGYQPVVWIGIVLMPFRIRARLSISDADPDPTPFLFRYRSGKETGIPGSGSFTKICPCWKIGLFLLFIHRSASLDIVLSFSLLPVSIFFKQYIYGTEIFWERSIV